MRLELKGIPLFSRAPASVLKQLGEACEPRTFPPFSTIATRGRCSSELFFVHKGHVNVVETNGMVEKVSVLLCSLVLGSRWVGGPASGWQTH
jgi:F-box/leucine-rich repeat protein 7